MEIKESSVKNDMKSSLEKHREPKTKEIVRKTTLVTTLKRANLKHLKQEKPKTSIFHKPDQGSPKDLMWKRSRGSQGMLIRIQKKGF